MPSMLNPKNLAPVCDFCGSPAIAWRYPARSFALLELTSGQHCASQGDWAACDVCHGLIEENARGALAERCAAMFRPIPPPEILVSFMEGMRLVHAAFFLTRTGPAVPTEAKAC